MAVFAFALACAASSALAAYEEVGHFAESGEAEELYGNKGAMAINASGVGLPAGEAGSLYVAGTNDRVVRYNATGEFREAWGWGVAKGEADEFQRCGPAIAEHPECNPQPNLGIGRGGEGVGQFNAPVAISIDPATGYVYVRNKWAAAREHNLIEVFNADGTQLITRFGEYSASSSIAESPENLHSDSEAPIAVDEAGKVYVVDQSSVAGHVEHRVMSFEPLAPGDYESYVYSGSASDIPMVGILEQGMQFPTKALAVDDAGHLYGASGRQVWELSLAQPSTAMCEYTTPGLSLVSMAVNSVTGEVFFSEKGKVYRLKTCAGGLFKEAQAPLTPTPRFTNGQFAAMVVNPAWAWPGRPPGVLYGDDSRIKEDTGISYGIGDVFAPGEVHSPVVVSQGSSGVGTGSAVLDGEVNPEGSTTSYVFQYETEAEYEANRPDEAQSLTVSATGGVFSLSDGGDSYGGGFTADLSEGSTAASGLVTARGAGSLSAAVGTATLRAAVGTGTVIAGSSTITALSASEGVFEAGQVVAGPGIPLGTKITAVSGSQLTLSTAATSSEANAGLRAGSLALSSVTASEGVFEAGQRVEGEGIQGGTEITAVNGGEATLSQPVTKSGTDVAITAGSPRIGSLTVSEGAFEPGQQVEGEGILAGTTVRAVEADALVLSKPVSKSGTGVAIVSVGAGPLAPGQAIAGPGIAPGTTIASVKPGELTLSAPAVATEADVHLHAGLPFDAAPTDVRGALESFPAIGAGNVTVSGGPGDETGSSPYEIEFTGAFANSQVGQVVTSGAGLTGGAASAEVAVVNTGGDGFSGAIEAPAGGAVLGSGVSAISASKTVTGLSPDTEYRYRVVATSHCDPEHEAQICEDVGSPAAFRTFSLTPAGLPDHRAYELVSPAEKNGGEVFPIEPGWASCLGEGGCKPPRGTDPSALYPVQSSPDGEAVVYEGYPFSANGGATEYNEYLSRRTSTGWGTIDLNPALGAQANGSGYLAFDAGLDEAIFLQRGATLGAGAPNGYSDLYVQRALDPATFSPLLTATPSDRAGVELELRYAGHSADFSQQFFAANDALTATTAFAPAPPDPGKTGSDLYEWREGELALVNVLPGNTTVAVGAAFASLSPDVHAISTDGSRVFWSAGGHLYVRIGGQQTVEIGDSSGFLSASADGSEVLLSDGKIYRFNEEADSYEQYSDLTAGRNGFQGILGDGEEGDALSHVYFVDTAVLPGTGANEHGEEPAAGKDNLYSWEPSGETRFVVGLLSNDSQSTSQGEYGDWSPDPAGRTAAASGNGRWLTFMSRALLTGYKNVGPRCIHTSHGTVESGVCSEVFVYDSATGRLSCASCNPTGERPLGRSTLPLIEGAYEIDYGGSIPQPRFVTDSGRVFFDSEDRLSSFDTNAPVEDVYEFEPEGAGSCVRRSGCVFLITPGTGTADSDFLAVDESGKDVFFTTRERLVPQQDTDELIDVYDAREGGGFASASENQRGECQGESCQGTPSPPVFTTPGSATFNGAGNASPSVSPRATKPKPATDRAKALAKQLRACRVKRVKRQRVACEKLARKRAGQARVGRQSSGRGVKR